MRRWLESESFLTGITLYQVVRALTYCRSNFDSDKYYELNFEDILNSPVETRDKLCDWLDVQTVSNKTAEEIDIKRASKPNNVYPDDVVNKVKEILQPVINKLQN